MKIRLIACLTVLLAVAACAPAGYYDSNGEYRSYGKSDSFRHDKPMAGTPDTDSVQTVPATTTTVIYTKPGYYDSNGYYIESNTAPHISEDYLPPRGMCRIWFPGRSIDYQPQVESCTGIHSRVPAGAYVIYGG